MSLFSSDRERRLWLWTLVVVTAIYASLGLTQDLAGALRERGFIGPAFILGMVLMAAAILLQASKRRPGGREIGVAFGVVAVYLIAFLRMATPEERTRLVEYSVVALFIYEALAERAGQGRRVRWPALLAVLGTAGLGWLDEGIQALLPGRFYDLRDVGFNALAALMAVGASVALAWARRRVGRSP